MQFILSNIFCDGYTSAAALAHGFARNERRDQPTQALFGCARPVIPAPCAVRVGFHVSESMRQVREWVIQDELQETPEALNQIERYDHRFP